MSWVAYTAHDCGRTECPLRVLPWVGEGLAFDVKRGSLSCPQGEGRNGNSLNCLANEGGSGLPHSIASVEATSDGSKRRTGEWRNGNSLNSVSGGLAGVCTIQPRAICVEAGVGGVHGCGASFDTFHIRGPRSCP